MGLTFLGSEDDGADLVRRGREVVEQLGDLDERRRAASNLAYALLMAGDTAGACAVALDGLAMLTRYGLEAQAGAALTGNALVLLRLVGRWDEAARLSDQVLARGIPDAQARYVHLARAGLDIARGDFDDARAHLDRARPPQVVDQTHPLLAAELAAAESELDLELGRLDEARDLIESALSLVATGEHSRLAVQLCRLGLQVEAEIAVRDRAAKNADPRAAERRAALVDLLSAIRRTGPRHEVKAHAAVARAEHGRCLLESDPGAWMTAARAWEALARPRDRAYCALRWAEAELDTRGSLTAAAAPLQLGHRLAVDLGRRPCCGSRTASHGAPGSRFPPTRPAPGSTSRSTPIRWFADCASRRASSTCSRNWRTGPVIRRSHRASTSAIERSLCTCRTCSPSWAYRGADRPPPRHFASDSSTGKEPGMPDGMFAELTGDNNIRIVVPRSAAVTSTLDAQGRITLELTRVSAKALRAELDEQLKGDQPTLA